MDSIRTHKVSNQEKYARFQDSLQVASLSRSRLELVMLAYSTIHIKRSSDFAVPSCQPRSTGTVCFWLHYSAAAGIVLSQTLSSPLHLASSDTKRLVRPATDTKIQELCRQSFGVLQGFNTRWVEKGTNDMVYCHALFLGGLTQLLAGMWGQPLPHPPFPFLFAGKHVLCQ